MKRVYVGLSFVAIVCLIYFIFVPAFAGRLFISPEIKFGNFSLRLYGLTLATAVLTGFLIARKYSWRFGIDKKEVEDFGFWLIVVSLMGARLYFVITEWEFYSQYPSEIYKVWHGGLSFFGALIGGLLLAYFWTRKKAYSVFQLLDVLAIGVPLAQAVGRLGNFFNQEAFGKPTDLPWKMFVAEEFRPEKFVNFNFFHPTFLYEILVNIVIFIALLKLMNKAKPGVLAFAYLAMYAFARFFIEELRLDSTIIRGFKLDQVTAFAVFLVAGFFVVRKQFYKIEKVG